MKKFQKLMLLPITASLLAQPRPMPVTAPSIAPAVPAIPVARTIPPSHPLPTPIQPAAPHAPNITAEATPIPVSMPDDAKAAAQEFLNDMKELSVNYEAKQTAIIKLVKSAINYLLTHRDEEAFKAILYDRQFVLGETELLVLDTNGMVYAHYNPAETWTNILNDTNDEGIKTTELVIKTAVQGGGWVNYSWSGHYKSTYAELVEKNGKKYVVAGGFYPSTKKAEVEALVASAVAEFAKNGRDAAFTEFDNKVGNFVKGNLYIFAYDMKGYCVAHGDNTSLIGRNLLDLKDDDGNYIVKAILKAAQEHKQWVSYRWNGSQKDSYLQKVTDKTGNSYIIGCGYHPGDSTEVVVSLVKRAVKDFNARGRRTVVDRFNYNPDFRIGDLTVFMYSFNGKVLADGEDPQIVGQNLYDLRSITGEFVMKEIIEKAKTGGGWVEYDSKGGWKVSYVEKVTDKQGSYVIGAGFYPYTARERTLRLVKRGSEYLRSHTKHEAFRAFGDEKNSFIKGDLDVFVFNPFGDCLAYGRDYDLIFRNFKNYRDPNGKPVFSVFLETIREDGSGWISYKSRNTTKMVYIEKVEKEDGEWFIVGSGFYK